MNVYEILNKLSERRPLFHSEADFQHELAWLIHEEFPDAKIRLEIPSGRDGVKEHLDLVVTLEKKKIVFELKYKKTAINVNIKNEQFVLKSDSALDISRYDYIKDISRIESYVLRNKNSIGYAIMITNEDIFWREMKPGQNSEQFFLHEGRIIPKDNYLCWHGKASDGTKFGRTERLYLRNSYKFNWIDFSKIGEGRWLLFKALVVKIV